MLKRLVVGLHGTATDLKRYDTLVDKCFTKFLQRVEASVEEIDRVAAAVRTETTTTYEHPKSQRTQPTWADYDVAFYDLPWFLVFFPALAAGACALLFYHFHAQQQQQQRRELRLLQALPPPAMTATTAVNPIIASTDDVALSDYANAPGRDTVAR